MIERLRGELIEKQSGHIVVAAGGVGYGLDIPLSTFERLPPETQPVDLHVHTHVREDALILYGFGTRDEREAFEVLLSVSGVGPALALAVLSQMSPGTLASAVESGAAEALTRTKGIGKRTGERIVLELKGKLARYGWFGGATSATPSLALGPVLRDAVAGLMNLGMKQPQAERAIAQASADLGESATVEQLLVEGLKNRK